MISLNVYITPNHHPITQKDSLIIHDISRNPHAISIFIIVIGLSLHHECNRKVQKKIIESQHQAPLPKLNLVTNSSLHIYRETATLAPLCQVSNVVGV